jgi:predicted O-methyltransferase YrrM
MIKIRDFIFRTKLLRILIPIIKLVIIFKFNFINIKKSIIWLFKNSEFTNFFYEITPLNRNQMIGAISSISYKSVSEVEQYFSEIENDIEFKKVLETKSDRLPRSRELPSPIPLGRRVAWYALIRIYKPKVVVETGTDKGIGSLVIQRALEKNGLGILYTLDIDRYSGSMFDESDLKKIKLLIGDSIESIKSINDVDLFIHDSDHSAEHERNEYLAISPKLTHNALVISDNSHVTDALFNWSKEKNRNFIFIKESPQNHWYQGGGVGISLIGDGGGS